MSSWTGGIGTVGRRVLELAVLVLLLAIAIGTVRLSLNRPWDTETYWYAAVAQSQGLNPYDKQDLSLLAHRDVGMGFLYPPITLPLFKTLTLWPVLEAAEIWAIAKVALLFVLVQLWRSRFTVRTNPFLLEMAAVFGYNAAALWDIKTGNIAILEQLLLWAGLAAFLGGHRRRFAAWVVAASLFKLTPIVFLALLLIPTQTGRRDWKLALGALGVWAALVFLPALVGPAWCRAYLHSLPAERPWGTASPSALGLIDMLLAEHTKPLAAPSWRALAIWLSYAVLLLAFSAQHIKRLWKGQNPLECVSVAAILYALLAPRMMAYSYLLVVVPSLVLFSPILSRLGGTIAMTGILTSQAVLAPVLRLDYADPWLANLPFLLLLGLWVAYIVGSWRLAPIPAVRRGSVLRELKEARS
ncbi:MAG TPA: glycosyltransferase family 87 protein [Candidatus Dormibacteraeota bacterium]|nr:glycosyltransferase family 87 protein [Candidatus Dormibacteraeota bacterium]